MSDPELIKVVSPTGEILTPCTKERSVQLIRKGKATKYADIDGFYIQLNDNNNKKVNQCHCCCGNVPITMTPGKANILTAIIKDKKDNILSIGKNSYIKTHPMMVKLAREFGEFSSKNVFIHAEIDAITKCQDLTKAYSIEIFRYSESKKRYVTSKPCKICITGIEKTPIKFIKYINNKGELVIERNK